MELSVRYAQIPSIGTIISELALLAGMAKPTTKPANNASAPMNSFSQGITVSAATSPNILT